MSMLFMTKTATFVLAVLVSAVFWRTEGSRAGLARDIPPALRLTVLYDNHRHEASTLKDWGFSCLVEGTEKTILFDTGAKPQTLIHNAEALNVDLGKVDFIVLSHLHGDHTGGLPAGLERNPNATVFFPLSFPPEFGNRVTGLKAKARSVGDPVEICRDVYLTGEMGDAVKEQSLIIDSPQGLVIVTGCSHPGIVSILRRAKEILDKPIHLVFGGFHLGDKSDAAMEDIMAAFKEMKVENCGATHCTGDKPIAAFKAAFGDHYIPMGTGKVIGIFSPETP